MKIVHINATYGVGSTGQIVKDLHEAALCAGHESHAFWATATIYSSHSHNIHRIGNELDHKLHALFRRLGGLQGSHSRISTALFCRKLNELNPDVVHLHNLHSNYINIPMLLKCLADMQVRIVITLHDCWFLTGYCTYYQSYKCENWTQACEDCPAVCSTWKKRQVQKRKACLQEAFAHMKRVDLIGVSPWITTAGSKAIKRKHITAACIYNWVDTNTFYPIDSSERIREKYQVPSHHKIILGVSQEWSSRKGLDDMLMLADSLQEQVTVLLVGDRGHAPDRVNIRYLGRKNKNELVELYSAADVFVNPSRMETFGLVTAEAMACGTPVVCYDNTAFKDIVPQQCGILVDDGKIEKIVQAVMHVLREGKIMHSDNCRAWCKMMFDKSRQIQKYLDVYHSEI